MAETKDKKMCFVITPIGGNNSDIRRHIDGIDENTIFYINDPTGANELKLKLIEFEKSIDLENQKYGPVYKVINKIPLYNEVESGESVSEKQLLQYINDKLDYLERAVSIKRQNAPREISKSLEKRKILIHFERDEPFTEYEVDRILSVIAFLDCEDVKDEKNEKSLDITCTVNGRKLEEFKGELKRQMSNMNISYQILYASNQ